MADEKVFDSFTGRTSGNKINAYDTEAHNDIEALQEENEELKGQIEELNETLTELDRYAAVGLRNNVTDNPWFKVCSYSTSLNYADPYIKFLVSKHYLYNENENMGSGILTVHVRTDTSASTGIMKSTSELLWDFVTAGIDISNFKVICQKDDSGLLTITLYCKETVRYTCHWFIVLDEGNTWTHEKLWTLYDNISSVGGDYDDDSLPEGTVLESTLMTIQNPVSNT